MLETDPSIPKIMPLEDLPQSYSIEFSGFSELEYSRFILCPARL
jgi:hypothetical protein